MDPKALVAISTMSATNIEGNPEYRCDARCLLGVGHAGEHLADDGSPNVATYRQHWKDQAMAALRTLRRTPGGSGKRVSRRETVAELAERFGISRPTLYRWEKREREPQMLSRRIPPSEKKALGTIAKLAHWTERACNVDTLRHLAGKPEALKRARAIIGLSLKRLTELTAELERSGQGDGGDGASFRNSGRA